MAEMGEEPSTQGGDSGMPGAMIQQHTSEVEKPITEEEVNLISSDFYCAICN